MDSLVRQLDMSRQTYGGLVGESGERKKQTIGVAKHDASLDAQSLAGFDNAHRNLPTIGNQNLVKHGTARKSYVNVCVHDSFCFFTPTTAKPNPLWLHCLQLKIPTQDVP